MTKELSTESVASTIESTALTSNDLIFAPNSMRDMDAIAQLMAQGVATVPEHLRQKPADCLAIVMQAAAWNMSPYQVAAKTHLVSGTLGYEAQLINAVVSSSTAIQGRFHYEFSEGWERLAGKSRIGPVQKINFKTKQPYTVEQPIADWTAEDEAGLWVKVGAVIAGEQDITWGEKLFLSGILVRNSPLWVTKPDQQISYLALKYWSRLYTPAVIMGVYTPEEIQAFPDREPEKEVKGERVADMKPQSETEAVLDDFDDSPAAEEGEKKHVFEDVDTILQEIAGAEELDDLEALKDKAGNVEGKYLDAVREAYNARGKAIIQSYGPKDVQTESNDQEE